MRKQGLYSAASLRVGRVPPAASLPHGAAAGLVSSPPSIPTPLAWHQVLGARLAFALSLLFLVSLATAWLAWPGAPAGGQAFDQAAFDAAFGRAVAQRDKQIGAAPAYAAIAPSLVRIRSLKRSEPRGAAQGKLREGVGSGVVIVDTGVILTALHVVDDMDQVVVQFHDGSESPAFIVSKRPEQDLAVLRVGRVPDELVAARLASSANLQIGESVMTVGFPFGFGASASAGVVSGLNREFRAREGQAPLRRRSRSSRLAGSANSA